MISIVKVERDSNYKLFCEGCLSTGRVLSTPPEKYLDIYHQLLDNVKPEVHEGMTSGMQLCWECNAVLCNIMKFKLRVQGAQLYLQQFVSNVQDLITKSLSNLSMVVCNSENDIHYEYNDGDDVKTEIEVDYCMNNGSDLIKQEEVDISDHNNDDSNLNLDEINPKIEEGNTVLENCEALKLKNEEPLLMTNVKTVNIERKKRGHIMRKRENQIKCGKNVEVICMTDSSLNIEEYFQRTTVTEEELAILLEREREDRVYLSKTFKCEECIDGFTDIESLQKHNEINHSKIDNLYICNLCKTCLPTKKTMQRHWLSHLQVYKCNLCSFVFVKKWKRKHHLEEHHMNLYKCEECKHHFENYEDFNVHYNEVHKQFICDYCNKRFSKKQIIETHIRRNHIPPRCGLCSRSYTTYDSLQVHYRTKHPNMTTERMKTEDSYCVECDKQFVSVYKYRTHLRNSVKHNAPKKMSVPCPECGKVFTKKIYMTNHYNLTHLKKSKHHCQPCDKYFITGFSLRKHTQTVHDKIVNPKNKICDICGRGFSVNRALNRHMRTHTGERPHRCSKCQAAFARKTTLTSHTRAVHAAK